MYVLSGRDMAAENWSWFPGNFLSVGQGHSEDRCQPGQREETVLGGWARAALSGPWPSFLGTLGARGLAEV